MPPEESFDSRKMQRDVATICLALLAGSQSPLGAVPEGELYGRLECNRERWAVIKGALEKIGWVISSHGSVSLTPLGKIHSERIAAALAKVKAEDIRRHS